MRKNWWRFRLAIFSLALVALGIYLFHFTPWRKALGLQPDYQAPIAEGDRLVVAIFRYHDQTALWPEYLEDVETGSCQYAWFYEVQHLGSGHRQPALSTNAPAEGGRAHLAFAFGLNAGEGDWHVFTGISDRIQRAGPPEMNPIAAARTRAQPLDVRANAVAEVRKRIAREPTLLEHRQDLVSLLLLQEHLAGAQSALDAAVRDLPLAAWPRLARAELAINHPGGGANASLPPGGPEAVQAYIDWAANHASLTALFGTNHLMRTLGDETRAAEAAAAAIGQPIEVDPDDTRIAAFYLWDMACWALQTERWALAIDICNVWQKARDAGQVKDESFLGLRGAAEVGAGNFAAATADLQLAEKADPAWMHAASESLQFLAQAARTGNAEARLTIPPLPERYALFVEPE